MQSQPWRGSALCNNFDSMPATLTICMDCERNALRSPRRGKAAAEAISGLINLLQQRKRLQGLDIVRERCLLHCPVGKVCVALVRDGQETRHHLCPQDDLKAVARKLASPPAR